MIDKAQALYQKRRQQREDLLADIALEFEVFYRDQGPKDFHKRMIAGFGYQTADAVCDLMRALRRVRKKIGET